MALYLKLPGAIGSRQINMATVIPEVVIFRTVDYKESTIQRPLNFS